MQSRWYYRDDFYKYGPLTWEQLLSAARAGRLKPSHVVSEDEGEWTSAGSIAELFTQTSDKPTTTGKSPPPPQEPPPKPASPAQSSVPPQRPTTAAESPPSPEPPPKPVSPPRSSVPPEPAKPDVAPTMAWDLGSDDSAPGGTVVDVPSPSDGSAPVEATMAWDISSDSAPGGTVADGSEQEGSDAFDIFEESDSSSPQGPGATGILRQLSPGSLLGNYEILETLGEGGMGTVLKARHVRMQRLVALKVLRTQTTKPAGAIQRFQQEVLAASRLTHPNIVTAHDADEVNGVHFLVMEYVDGVDLDELLAERKELPYKEAVSYIIQVATGLAYAHHEGVIHRDIKPANLMLDQRKIVKILDMGLASVKQTTTERAKKHASVHVTQADQILGTFDFMPPEQAEDARSADHRADIYALGCTMFKLVTGKAPYSGKTAIQKIFAHREHPIPTMSKLHPDVPFDLDSIFAKMVAKEADMRYQSMDDVIADLQACLKSEPVSVGLTGNFGQTKSGGTTRVHEEVLRIEPSSSDDDLDEYMLSPVDEKKQTLQEKSDTKKIDGLTSEVPRWFWKVMGEELGPFTLANLKRQKLNTWDEVRREGSDSWIPAQEVEGLFN